MESVHELTFVLVNTFNLFLTKKINSHKTIQTILSMAFVLGCQIETPGLRSHRILFGDTGLHLVFLFNCLNRALKNWIFSKCLQLNQLIQVRNPIFANVLYMKNNRDLSQL